jgi:stage II sporulation protein D
MRTALPLIAALLLLLLPPCCSKFGMTPNPDRWSAPQNAAAAEDKNSAWGESLAGSAVRTRDIDFARAFEEDGAPRRPADAAANFPRKPPQPPTWSLRYPPIRVKFRPVRALIKRGAQEATLNASAPAQIYTPNGSMSFRGRMHIDATFKLENAVIATVNNVKKEMRLPCTLAVFSATNMLELDGNNYRGAIIVAPDGAGAVSLINSVNVEEYLRGVVPLEIGSLGENELEALKAQAVAARTYTYKKMALNAGKPYDVATTTADQVYGGANAEADAPDKAISATNGLIIAYGNEVIDACYHSTCGGQTANVEDAWGGESRPYLRSRSDADKSGKPYCGQSSTFRWTETWSASRLSGILKRHAAEGALSPPYNGGAIRRIEARGRHQCGRVKQLAIVTSAGECLTTGEKARHALRRNTPAEPILRSANFNNATFINGEITITGTGYGHGVGMCQVGAIARARAKENFEQILRAYYTDTALRTAVEGH